MTVTVRLFVNKLFPQPVFYSLIDPAPLGIRAISKNIMDRLIRLLIRKDVNNGLEVVFLVKKKQILRHQVSPICNFFFLQIKGLKIFILI